MEVQSEANPGGGGGGVAADGPVTDIALHLECTRLRAENRRLIDQMAQLVATNNTATLFQLEKARNTVLNQQIELTKLNRAIERRNRKITRLKEQNSRYRFWASSMPIEADRSLMRSAQERIQRLRDADAREKIGRDL